MDNQKLKNIIEHFRIEGEINDVRPLGNGLINDTYLASTKDNKNPDYVLQRINTNIFKDPDLLQDNLVKITNHIRKKLIEKGEKDVEHKTLTIVPTKDGKLYFSEGNDTWRLTVLIPESVTHETINPEMAYLTGKAFGEFHSYFDGDDCPELKESIPDFHNIEFRIENLKKSVEKDSAGRLSEVKAIVDELLSRSEEMCQAVRLYEEGKLPKRISHCDTKVNNILFDKNGNIKCVIDLDTTMPGFILSDFGDFIRSAGNKGEEDDQNLDNVELNMEIFKSFTKGYIEGAGFITEKERELLPFGAKMLTYMQTVRFLTDYLDGDKYYKIQYPEHNLIRTKAQLKLLHSLDDNFENMKQFISKL